MNIYQKHPKLAPVLMIAGFAMLVIGVVSEITLQMRAISWTFVGLGLVCYVAGRVGFYLTPKEPRVKRDGQIEI